jgi:hypothetical protein
MGHPRFVEGKEPYPFVMRARESHHKIQVENPIHQGPLLCDVFC